MQPARAPVYSFDKRGLKNGAVAALSSDYFLMVDRLILVNAPRTLRTASEVIGVSECMSLLYKIL
jgi:ABC-type uncharacterized transport system substrate-binding protein